MKRVVKDEDLRRKMKEAINLLCDTVKMTLGPKGSNSIIDHSMFSPFITNDGVTIAENIESDDEVINTILEIAKESSIKTNEVVGDGTTTTLVLLQSIFENGLKEINAGVNPILLKKELDNTLDELLKFITSKSRKPTKEELIHIACVSSNDDEIGKIVSQAYAKTKEKEAIIIKESDTHETSINFLKGYLMSSELASNYFLKENETLEFQNPYILLIDDVLEDLNDIADILNKIILEKQNLIIFADNYNELVINEVVSYNLNNNNKIVLLKNVGYGDEKQNILDDIKIITDASIIKNYDSIDSRSLGTIKNIKITSLYVIMSYFNSPQIKKRYKELKKIKRKGIENNDLRKRIAMFNYGCVEILIGAKTATERREKKMRFEDALWAVSSAYEGIIPGGGLILLELSDILKADSIGKKIFKNSLSSPFEQIIYNGGGDIKLIKQNIKELNYDVLYNLNTENFESVKNTKIIDPTKVVINSLLAATSIASMLLTTTSLIINERRNNIDVANEYNEL